MARKINSIGLDKIKLWEGLRLEAYPDDAGVLTIGYGDTRNVSPGMKITKEEAEKRLLQSISEHEDAVNLSVKVPLTDNQFAALVSFDFNTGSLSRSTLLKKLNAGDYASVPGEMAKWVYTTDRKTKKKVKSEGLVNRRAAEAGLWAKGAPISPASSQVLISQPPVITKESITWGAGIMATLSASFQGDGPVQWALGGIMAVCCLIGIVLFIQRRLKNA